MRSAGGAVPLRRDLRLDLFAIPFAIGTLHHELEFVVEVCLVGPLSEYMERWSRAVESTGWPSEVGLAAHGAVLAVSLLLIVLPRRRELLCVLAVAFLLSQMSSPHRIASHSGLMAGGLLVILLLGVAEWLERLACRRQPAGSVTDWYGWTLTGLTWICVLAYFFAAFYKLNAGWFSAQSAAPGFLLQLVDPILAPLGAPKIYRAILGAGAIYGTVVLELALPLLLFRPSTRLWGCLIGLVFHLPMIVRGIVNFPLLILAFYPAFLTVGEAHALVRACVARPGVPRPVGSVLLGGYGAWLVYRSPPRWMHESPWLHPLIPAVDHAMTAVAFALTGYVTLALGAWVLRGPGWVPGAGGGVIGDRPARDPDSGRSERRRLWRARALPAALALLVAGAFVYNNVAGLIGLPSAGAMIMYSGIRPDGGNHFLLGNVRTGAPFSYVSLRRFEVQGPSTPETREFAAFSRWLLDGGRHLVSLNFVRYHLARICRSAPGATVRLEVLMRPGRTWASNDACAEPRMVRYWTVLTRVPCSPGCGGAIRRWARGEPLTQRGKDFPPRRLPPDAGGL